MTFPSQDITTPPQAQFELLINEALRALLPASAYSKKPSTTSGLTFGYYGATLDGVAVADGTVALTASATNYVVVNRGTGAVGVSTATTNWNDAVNYARLYRLVTNATAVTTEEDNRVGSKGLFGNAGAGLTAVTSVAAQGGVRVVGGGPINTTGTLEAEELFNAQTGTTYAIVTGDRAKLITRANASAMADTLPQAGANFPNGWFVDYKNLGGGTVTITPTTSTIDGAANVQLTTGQSARIVSDGTNYQSLPGKASSGSGGLTYVTEARNAAAPNATVTVISLTNTDAAANSDIALVPKGNGALLADVPDNATAGGNKRGIYSTDFQRSRAAAADVAGGQHSVIGGGNDNEIGTSGAYAVIGGGNGNVISASEAVIAGGVVNTVSAALGSCLGGLGNTVSGTLGSVLGGSYNTASGAYSRASGRYAVTRGVIGACAHAAARFVNSGDAQQGDYVLMASTADATVKAMTSDNSVAGTDDQIVLVGAATYAFQGYVVARVQIAGDVAAWKIEGLVKIVSGTVSLVGTPTVTSLGADTGASAWSVAVAADNTNDALAINVTGAAATNIRWVAHVKTVEVAW